MNNEMNNDLNTRPPAIRNYRSRNSNKSNIRVRSLRRDRSNRVYNIDNERRILNSDRANKNVIDDNEGNGKYNGNDMSKVMDEPKFNDKLFMEEEVVPEEEDYYDYKEEFGALDRPIYEGFTNSDFKASTMVRGQNLQNILKALLISLVLCALCNNKVSNTIVTPLVKLTSNKINDSSMICVLIFIISYLVITSI